MWQRFAQGGEKSSSTPPLKPNQLDYMCRIPLLSTYNYMHHAHEISADGTGQLSSPLFPKMLGTDWGSIFATEFPYIYEKCGIDSVNLFQGPRDLFILPAEFSINVKEHTEERKNGARTPTF